MSPIQLSAYPVGLRVKAKHAKGFSLKLHRVAPEDASERLRAALHEIEAHADHVNTIRNIRERLASEGLKPFRALFMEGWGALHDTCAALARIPGAVIDRGVRAETLRAKLLPFGIGFVRDDTLAAWGEADRILARVDALGLRAEIEAVLGPGVLSAAEHGTRMLGDAIGVGDRLPTEAPSSTALREAISRLSEAIATYQVRLAAEMDTNDAASVARFRAAMAPIDEYRARRASAREEIEDEDAGEVDVAPPTEGGAPEPPVI